jgi:hypothetical protein
MAASTRTGRPAGPGPPTASASGSRSGPVSGPIASKRPAARKQPPAKPVGAKPVRALIPVVSGLVWALALMGALAVSSLLTAVVLVPVAAVATATGIRAVTARPGRRARSGLPSTLLYAGLAACIVDPLVALSGPLPGMAVLVLSGVGIAALVVLSSYAASARPLRSVSVRFVAAFVPTMVVTSVILARHQGSNLAMAMVGATLAYDMGAFLMGHGRTPLGGAVGVVSGWLSIGVVAVFVAAVMNPPFSGARPTAVFLGVAALAPLGVRLCQRPAGEERLPALRRLDSLSLVAPAWVVIAGAVLHR